MQRTSFRVLALTLLLTLSRLAAHGAGILDQLPADATAFVAIHNLASTSEKIERVTAIFQELTPGPLPAPLALAMGATGIGPGLNESGNALLALLPSDEAPFPPQPLMLLPVSDYEAFAAAVEGDASGEICRVVIAGEEVLLAKRGDFAALMNVEHRNQFEKILAAAPSASADLEPLADWLATTDVSAGLTRAGVERLAALGRRGIADVRQQAEANLRDPETEAMLKQIQQSMRMYDMAVEFLGAEVKAGAIGLSIDDDANVRLAKRILVSTAGELGGAAEVKPLATSLLAPMEPKPFVVAGGGPIPPNYGQVVAKMMRRIIEQLPKGQGYEGFVEDDWKKMEESYRESMAGMKSISFVLYPGENDEGLLSNYFFVSKVEDSTAYLAGYRKSIVTYNELMEKADNDLVIAYELNDAEIGGKPAIEATADIAAAAADPNVAMVAPMMKAMFGEDGKMRMYAVAADTTTVVIGISTPENLTKAVEFVVSGKDGLASESAVDATLKLLDPQAPWTGLLSPQGAVMWATRWFEKVIAPFAGGGATIPPFPQTAPIGFSINLANGQIQGEMVLPVDLLKGVAEYVKKVQAM